MKNIILVLFIITGLKLLQKPPDGEQLKTKIEVAEKKKIDRAIEIMEEMGIRFPRIVFCQMVLETGSFSSAIYKFNHNPFGMKESSRNWDSGSQKGHAYYHSLHEAMMDYADWQKSWSRSRQAKTEEEYLAFLNNLNGKGLRYAEDPLYTDKLLLIRKKLFD